jgi:hypothetical protein
MARLRDADGNPLLDASGGYLYDANGIDPAEEIPGLPFGLGAGGTGRYFTYKDWKKLLAEMRTEREEAHQRANPKPKHIPRPKSKNGLLGPGRAVPEPIAIPAAAPPLDVSDRLRHAAAMDDEEALIALLF